ncbi:hypothetical protein [Clostridium sp. JN-1]|uniref:hypothetical protein n=1 Tax=Clostridium sp. JN-1 TaxID=2483110 RepID=UPI000F0B858F|nr:hypothetical protein [Clostridium sp. JN-1]
MIDITKLPPDTIITNERLSTQQGKRFMVIEDEGKCNEIVRENTTIELKAYRAYHNIKHKDKVLIRAMVTYSDLGKHFYDDEFILDYETIEILEKGM